MSKEIVVLGAGIVGVSVAWHLQKEGYHVTLMDRKKPGSETSFGNVGLIQREAIRPYPFPRSISKILKVLPNKEIDIRYRLSEIINKARPLWHYWDNSNPKKYEQISAEYSTLIEKCLDAHDEMIQSSNAETFVSKKGYIEIYQSKTKLEERKREIEEHIQGNGVEYQFLDKEQLAALEPAIQVEMAGGVHWSQVWSAQSPQDIVNTYFEHFLLLGGSFIEGEIKSLNKSTNSWEVEIGQQTLTFEQSVLCLGPWSALWLKKQGVSIPLFFKKGYHLHYTHNEKRKLQHPILVADTGFAIAPMPHGVRLCTGAELSGLKSNSSYDQLKLAEEKARELFLLGKQVEETPWSGARPCLPDMKPIISPSDKQKGLWLAFGHGHQGFTLGPLTGRLIAQMVKGVEPEINLAPFHVNRFY